jgi:hypothetical protein
MYFLGLDLAWGKNEDTFSGNSKRGRLCEYLTGLGLPRDGDHRVDVQIARQVHRGGIDADMPEGDLYCGAVDSGDLSIEERSDRD